ncbi:hypothetical protein PRIPAC_76016 [Pristionchus pacificus]|uniref:Uncharacterized protein n=1 Tax=Pristionchus pacificus TaxID=54126 RepID=A0A2A6BRH9_PRIPA|nr:hypothetical protein PRIPAC_76016 [Pristionchus pacificus]|eukprot:PDM68562.1 hypothetical protein PRIPAC_44064 [Pristionchus pacificus]
MAKRQVWGNGKETIAETNLALVLIINDDLRFGRHFGALGILIIAHLDLLLDLLSHSIGHLSLLTLLRFFRLAVFRCSSGHDVGSALASVLSAPSITPSLLSPSAFFASSSPTSTRGFVSSDLAISPVCNDGHGLEVGHVEGCLNDVPLGTDLLIIRHLILVRLSHWPGSDQTGAGGFIGTNRRPGRDRPRAHNGFLKEENGTRADLIGGLGGLGSLSGLIHRLVGFSRSGDGGLQFILPFVFYSFSY